MKELNLTKGTWLIGDCGKHHQAGNHCQMKFVAPASQEEELKQTLIQHAQTVHNVQDIQKLKTDLNNLIEKVNI